MDTPAIWFATTLAMGTSAPCLGPSMRAQWPYFTDDGPLKSQAYALDTVCEESLYLGGPIIAAAIMAVSPARTGLMVAAALILIGGAGLFASPAAKATATTTMAMAAMAAPLDRRDRRGFGPPRTPGMLPLLATVAGYGVGLSAAYTAVAASADAQGNPASAGYVEAAIAAASVTAGLLWCRRRHGRPWCQQMALLGIPLATGTLLAAFAPSMWAMGLVLMVAGCAVAPAFSVAYTTSDDLAPTDERTEASAWINTTNNLASATGTSLSGLVAETPYPGAGFFVAAAVVVAAALSLTGWQRRQRRRGAGQNRLVAGPDRQRSVWS